jgi:outer membrane protein assembly factor BamB
MRNRIRIVRFPGNIHKKFSSAQVTKLIGTFLLFVSIEAIAIVAAPGLLAQNSWSVSFPGIGTFSSPRVSDFNGDGVGDIVFGAGREEFHQCDSAIIALDGMTGKMLWHVPSIDNIFASAALKDINGDRVDDIVIGGRSAELFALNGKTGSVLWQFDKKQGKQKWFNFYNAQFIKDQNDDGMEDILISNGGNVLAAPSDPKERRPGTLAVISGRNGKLLAHASMPDKKETYMSVSALPINGGKDYQIIFGSGGETLGGHLYLTNLSDIFKGDLSRAIVLDSSANKGYIAPAVWIDITGDAIPDIVANAVAGKLLAFDGKTHAPIWSVKVPNSEAYSSIAPGHFTGDSTADFFVSYAIGIWPKLEWSKQVMVDGASGKIAYLDSLGFYQTSTPVVIDLDGNGRDESLLSVNIYVYDEKNERALYNVIMSLDFATKEANQFTEPEKGSNISTTPWIGDLDHDGLLDIIYFHETNTKKSYTFDGMRVSRVATKIPIHTRIKWGAYMGSGNDGIFNIE